jgi:ATP-binding cassette subfamily F protein 3
MDEPTNHLDIWSCEALERSISEFEGTVLVVSHDRYFLNQVADRLVVVAEGQARVIEGDYEAYQRLLKEQSQAGPARSAKAATATAEKAAERVEKKRRKYPYRKAAEIEREIGQLEAEKAELDEALGRPETWKDADRARSTRSRHDEVEASLARLYEHWEESLELNA